MPGGAPSPAVPVGSPSIRTAYLAAEGFVGELEHELGAVELRHGRLLIASGPPRPAAWAANIWVDPQAIAVASISDASAKLRAIQRNWAMYAPHLHRRATLIQEQLPKVSAKPLGFGSAPSSAPLGSWTLLDASTILAAPHCTSPFPNGEVRFVEDHTGPPSRAYLKLWEALTLIGERPTPGEICVDLGSSPGGWTWALQQMGAQVISVDKAPLGGGLQRLPGVERRRQSAFALEPRELGPIDWLFSDIVCYPPRLLALVERWVAAGSCRHFVCTIKFQGTTDHETARRFAAIPGSQLRHLFHNKHELTWTKIG
ncbi:MAG TPA: SAM-dependent methyltransferase [Stellaceae bacterium]|nr:SAM-dependent methyltransferase [Stellaceae bacterium]